MSNNKSEISQPENNVGVKPGTTRPARTVSPSGTIPKEKEVDMTAKAGMSGGCPMRSAAEVAKMGGAGAHMGYLGHFGQDANLNQGHNTGAHPGFKAVQSKIAAKEGVSKERAGAMLAASTRRAGKAARKANPRLNRVKG